MSAPCSHPRWVRRADEDRGIRCRYRCATCGAAGWRRFREPEASIRLCLIAEAREVREASELDLRIKERFQRERIEGGLYVPLGECNGTTIYHPRGERS